MLLVMTPASSAWFALAAFFFFSSSSFIFCFLFFSAPFLLPLSMFHELLHFLHLLLHGKRHLLNLHLHGHLRECSSRCSRCLLIVGFISYNGNSELINYLMIEPQFSEDELFAFCLLLFFCFLAVLVAVTSVLAFVAVVVDVVIGS